MLQDDGVVVQDVVDREKYEAFSSLEARRTEDRPPSNKILVYKYTEEELPLALMRICTTDVASKTDSVYQGRVKDIIPSDGSILTLAQARVILPAVVSLMRGRTLVSTSQGMVELAPDECQLGDLVCIIMGNETPVVLRSCGEGQYTWVREYYIHGIMDGECMELSKQLPGLETAISEFCTV